MEEVSLCDNKNTFLRFGDGLDVWLNLCKKI